MKILLLHGPNLDMLGVREPAIYGADTLDDIEQMVVDYCADKNIECDCFQSNYEGALIEEIHEAMGEYDGIVYNPGAHTHYSYALRDAVASIDVPVIEVHLSDVDDREDFRKFSVFDGVVAGKVKGKGKAGYLEAVDLLLS